MVLASIAEVADALLSRPNEIAPCCCGTNGPGVVITTVRSQPLRSQRPKLSERAQMVIPVATYDEAT